MQRDCHLLVTGPERARPITVINVFSTKSFAIANGLLSSKLVGAVGSDFAIGALQLSKGLKSVGIEVEVATFGAFFFMGNANNRAVLI